MTMTRGEVVEGLRRGVEIAAGQWGAECDACRVMREAVALLTPPPPPPSGSEAAGGATKMMRAEYLAARRAWVQRHPKVLALADTLRASLRPAHARPGEAEPPAAFAARCAAARAGKAGALGLLTALKDELRLEFDWALGGLPPAAPVGQRRGPAGMSERARSDAFDLAARVRAVAVRSEPADARELQRAAELLRALVMREVAP